MAAVIGAVIEASARQARRQQVYRTVASTGRDMDIATILDIAGMCALLLAVSSPFLVWRWLQWRRENPTAARREGVITVVVSVAAFALIFTFGAWLRDIMFPYFEPIGPAVARGLRWLGL